MKTFSQFISEVTLQKGETYGSPEYQRRKREEEENQRKEKAAQNRADTEAARKDRAKGIMRGSKDGVSGYFKYNQATKRFDIFVPGQPD